MNYYPMFRNKSSGFTLIELMVAVTLGLLLTSAIASLFISSRQSYDQDEAVTRMQDELRYAMTQIVRDVEMAGYWDEVFDPGNVSADSGISTFTGCGSSFAVNTGFDQPLIIADNQDSVTSTFSCVGSGIQAKTDVLAIRRLAGNSVAGSTISTEAADLMAGKIYLESTDAVGVLKIIAANAINTTRKYIQYTPSVYYIRAADTSTKTPTQLCRETLGQSGGNPAMTRQCFASGIENLQVEVGLDTDNDGVSNRFISAPTSDELKQATALRISLLAKSEEAVESYSNQKTYTLGNAPSASNLGKHYGRVQTAVVLLRNPAALRKIQ